MKPAGEPHRVVWTSQWFVSGMCHVPYWLGRVAYSVLVGPWEKEEKAALS